MRKAFTSPEKFIYTLSVTSPRTALDIRAAAITAGWDTVKPLQALIDISAAGAIYSTTTASAVKYVGTLPDSSSIYIRNAGIIYGTPGAGGKGGDTALSTSPLSGVDGTAGGIAVEVNVPVLIDNTGGTIAGGAGGGGGGGGGWDSTNPQAGGGGAGGGGGVTYTGLNGGVGAVGGLGGNSFGSSFTASTAGGTGSTVGGTTGSAGQGNDGSGVTSVGGGGGDGALPGAAGAAGGAAQLGNTMASGGAGGAAGNYISGNSYVTWVANGTRTGGVA